MAKSGNTIYVDDIVQIINPEIVIRVGYEFSYDDAYKEIKETCGEDINELLRKVNVRRWEKVRREIMKSLAYDLISKKIHRGNKRIIFTEHNNRLTNMKVRVIGKKFARTGTYFPPVGGGDYYYSDDYEPGGLKHGKTHILLKLDAPGIHDKELFIESCNIKRCDLENF